MKKVLCLVLILSLLTAIPMIASAEEFGDKQVTLTLFYDHTWIPTDDFTGIIPEEITRLTGVTLDVTYAVDANQLGVLAASGDLPDLVYTQNMIDRLSDPNLCYSIEDLIEQYSVNWDITSNQLGIARGLSADGKAYTILNHVSTKADWEGSSSAPMVGTLCYRSDLLEELGNPEITDMDSLYAVLEKAHEAHPELVTLDLDEYWNVSVFRYLLGMGGLEFLEQEDGSYISYAEDPRYVEILKFLNKCYRAGFLSTDSPYFVAGSKAISNDMKFSATTSTQNGINGMNADVKKLDPSYEFHEMVPWDTADYTVSDYGWSGLFITKQNKDPETSIKFMAWMFTPEAQRLCQMGREGIDFTYDENGKVQFSDEWKEAMANGTHDKLYNPYFYFGGSETVEADARCATHDPAWTAEAYAIIRERYDNYPWIQAAQPIGDTDEKVIWEEFKELRNTYERKIIMADSDEAFDGLVQEFFANAERVGLSRLDAYMTEKIAELKPLYS